jgi:transposase
MWSQGKAYGQDLRDRVFALFDGGASVGQVAQQLLVSVSYVSKVLSRRRLTGELSARPQRCQVPLKLAPLHAAIATQVTAKPDATIDELRRWLAATHGVTASKGLMVKTLATLNLTHKKRQFMPPSRLDPTSPKRVRRGAMHCQSSMPAN